MMDFQNPVLVISAGAIVLLIAIFLVINHRKKKTVNLIERDQSVTKMAKEDNVIIKQEQQVELSIKFEDLPALTEEEESRLIEVHDNKLLARMDNAIPGTFQAIANAGAVHNYNQAVQSAGQLYRAVIPKGAVLTQSRSMGGAVRGFYRGAENIRGHANLVAVDGNMGRGVAAMGVANAAMGVASMVVGQYYMTQINNRLDTISNDIKQITGFQGNKYKSKVYALIAGVQKSSTFQMETMENEELRQRELMHLKNLEHECAELLGQANLTLQDYTKKNGLGYEEYEKAVSSANRWYQYQQILLEIMGKIGELTYALNLGAVSKDYCYAMYLPFAKQAEDTLNMLNEWHSKNIKRLEIDTKSTRRKRQGIEGFFMSIPALFNDDLNYKDISRHTAIMISQQSHASATVKPDSDSDYFQEDVELIAKDGKLYYLPPADNKAVS